MQPGATPPPGWYPDPAGSDKARWWTGSSWGETTAPVPPDAPPAVFHPPGLPAGNAYAYAHGGPPAAWHLARERAFFPWAQRCLAGIAVFQVASVINTLHYLPQVHRFYDYYLHTLPNARADGLPAPSIPPLPPGYASVSDLCSLAIIASFVILLMWQHRAAVTACGLGLPARRSPGWGVGSWFVPVVNFWFPYQALRDCFPPDDPARRRVIGFWLSYWFAIAATVASQVVALSNKGSGEALLAAAGALWIAAVLSGWHMVQGIHAAHNARVFP